jgi:type IV pilus assembly protein PilY1
VFVGTNDGVIHTINADPEGTGIGQEISGFIPDELMHSLKRIAVGRQYTFTADGQMAINDIYTGTTSNWRSMLLFGLRDGGRAYYGRDVTDPTNQSHRWKFPAYQASGTIDSINGNVLELSDMSGTFEVGQYVYNQTRSAFGVVTALPDTDEVTVSVSSGSLSVGDKILALPAYYDYIGKTYGLPAIGRIKYKKGVSGTVYDKWVAILTGGFGDGTDMQGKAIFIVDAWTGELLWWLGYAASDDITNDHYLKNDSNLNYPIPQSLTAIDKDNNTYLDAFYFGNLGGNLFKVDISDPQTSTWVPQILFRENNTNQPIYLSPSISYDQCYQLWVHFGTGNREHPQDGPSGLFIGLRDDSSVPVNGNTRSNDLQLLTWSSDTLTQTAIPTNKNGWYFNFPDTDEILFEPDPFVVPNNNVPYLFFNTYQADSAIVGDPCGSGGNMKLYSINLHSCGGDVSGSRESARISGGGLLTGSEFLMYVGTGETGSIEIKRFEKFIIPYAGGIIYWKETKR